MLKFLRGIKTSIISSQKKKALMAHATVGENVKTGKGFSVKNKSLNKQRIRIGNHCMVDGIISVGEKGLLEIGAYSSFKESDWISVREKVIIGSHVFASELVFISDNDNHPISPRKRWEMTETPLNTPLWKIDREDVISAPVIIEDCVWLGRGCMILKGVTIGRGSIIAAGAIVTKSVPPFSVVAGNPAKVVKAIENDLDV